MRTSRFHLAVAAGLLGSAALGALPGCSQSGPIATRRNTVGALKASVSQLEYSNENLKKQVADLKAEKTRVANALDEEAARNGDLAARLDDAKDALRRQDGGGVAALDRGGPASSPEKSRASTAAADDEIPPPRRSSSSSVRPSKSSRKPPTTQIPRIESSADAGPGALELPSADRFDPGPQASRLADDGRWLPVARGNGRGGPVEVR